MQKKLFMVLVVVVVAFGAFVFLSPSKNSTKTRPVTSLYSRGDVNRDGSVSSLDKELLRQNFGCSKTDACWQKVVGKTVDGDNPIYASDLDLNGDGTISDLDMALVQ